MKDKGDKEMARVIGGRKDAGRWKRKQIKWDSREDSPTQLSISRLLSINSQHLSTILLMSSWSATYIMSRTFWLVISK